MIFALGPLTNAAHVLTASPHLVSNVDELIAVMGRRPGHLFHPSEGIGRGSLLGHGPVFRDFTFSGDPEAAEQLLCLGRERFYPFDLMAAGYLLAPSLFRCADVPAWVGKDPILFAPLFRALALLVEPNRTHPARRTTYCPEVERECAARLQEWISAPS